MSFGVRMIEDCCHVEPSGLVCSEAAKDFCISSYMTNIRSLSQE